MSEHGGPSSATCSLSRMPGLGISQQSRQRGLAVDKWAVAQILAVCSIRAKA